MKRFILSIVCLALLTGAAAHAATYKVAWSHYTGWEPWGFADSAGIIKKWGKKYGIDIKVTLVNDYIESINLYTAGNFDACTMTNMDALTIPAVGGVDSTAIIVGDFSNGNDGIVMKKGNSIKQLKGREIKLVELSVSHYLLARALAKHGMSERDVRLVNTSDADIAAVFTSDPKGAVVTWNPPLQQVRNAKGAKMVFDSSMIPGEIIDLMVVKTKAPDSLKKALTGAWYEMMGIMSGRGKQSTKAIADMASAAGATVPEFKAQLKTTAMFYKPAEAAKFTKSQEVVKTMEHVRSFSFDKGLFGQNASNKDFVGIAFPGGKVLGNKKNVKLRFDASYMQMAADKKL